MNNMDQYISKAAIKAELEKLIKANELYLSESVTDEVRFQKTGAYSVCNDLLHFIDTLETKEVDFEEEFDKYANGILACDVQFEPFTHLYKCAKYFFELGLRTRE